MKPGPRTDRLHRVAHSWCKCGRIKAKDTRCCFRCSGCAEIIDRLVMQGRSTKPLVSPLVRLMQELDAQNAAAARE